MKNAVQNTIKALLLLGAVITFFFACEGVTPDGGNTGDTDTGDTDTGDTDGDNTPVALSSPDLAAFTIVAGYENEAEAEDLSLALSDEVVGETDGGNQSLEVTFQSTMDFRSAELYALLPDVADYSVYDGIRFDAALPVSMNMLNLIRIPDSASAYVIREDYLYRGTDDETELVWVTFNFNFTDNASVPGWSDIDTDTYTNLDEWLEAQAETQLQMNLNPILNTGAGDGYSTNAVDTPITFYLDNIGFYTTDATIANSEVVWDFEPAE